MFSAKLILSLLALAAYAVAVPEMDCYRHGLESLGYRHRETFVLNLAAGSQGSEGSLRNYDCTCLDQACERIDCRISRQEVDEDIAIVRIGGDDAEEEERPAVVIFPAPSTEACYDDVSSSYIERGATVVRPGTPSQGCKCPESGPLDIQCEDLTCQLAKSPDAVLPENMDYRNCFDPWMNRVYRNGARYNRTRVMNHYQDKVGKYACTCSFGHVRCQAFDIPCCDAVTGEFKGKGEKVSVDYRGSKMSCTCFGGRSSFRNCQFLRQTTPTKPASTNTSSRRQNENGRAPSVVRTTAAPTTPLRGPSYCTDRYANKRYREGAVYTQRRTNGMLFECTCRRSRQGYLQTTCQRIHRPQN